MLAHEPGGAEELHEFAPRDARRWLEQGRPPAAPLVLRPFLDAYHLVAERTADPGPRPGIPRRLVQFTASLR